MQFGYAEKFYLWKSDVSKKHWFSFVKGCLLLPLSYSIIILADLAEGHLRPAVNTVIEESEAVFFVVSDVLVVFVDNYPWLSL